ncbi:MAG: DUF3667 domain-containing protein [Woeseiaceae bacterium]|nr:DUF3667 domain-containing protein [Woeseiaceae bacterium]
MSKQAAELPEHEHCLNCGTRLHGQYCGHCGQRATSRLISLWELLRDAFGDMFELDSRLWRTLIPLLRRPGQLTRDYLEGRRARYMPPFRMYLVLSVIFFVVAFFDPRDNFSLLFEPEPPPTAEELEAEEATREEALDKAVEQLDELAAEGILPEEQATEALRQLEEQRDGRADITIYSSDDASDLNFDYDEETRECTVTGEESLPAWLQRRLTEDRLKKICERVAADKGKAIGALMLDNIPVALIVLLPFMALVLKALYPLSRRYFVEHLLFFVHFHSFFFLLLTLQILFSRLAGLVWVPEPVVILIIVTASFYIPVYLYKAMRRVYRQGHVFTLAKYVVLAVAYFAGAATTMLGATLVAIMSMSV